MIHLIRRGPDLFVDIEPEIPDEPPGVPQNTTIYLFDTVPVFEFDLLEEGAADIYRTESWLSSNPGNVMIVDTEDDVFDIKNGKRVGARTHPSSGTQLGTFPNPVTLYCRVRAIKNELEGQWSATLNIVRSY